MIKIIVIGSILLYVLFYHPGWFIVAGLILGGYWILRKKPDLFASAPAQGGSGASSKDRGEDLSERAKNFDIRKEYEKQVKAMLKPGFERDPIVIDFRRKFKAQVERNSLIESLRMERDKLKEQLAKMNVEQMVGN